MIKDIGAQTAVTAEYTVLYIMTHNLSFFCVGIFLFIFSSPTYDRCDTEGQQRATILGVGGRQSCTGNHGNTVLASLIPWPCQRVDKYLRKPWPIQHLHKRKPSRSARCENTPGRNSSDGLLFFYSISISHTTTDQQAWLLFLSTVSLILLLNHLHCEDS